MSHDQGMYFRKNRASKIFEKKRLEQPEKKSRYKDGKQEHPITFEEFCLCVAKAHNSLNEEQEGYIWMLYYTGVRKSEAYERPASDVVATERVVMGDIEREALVIIDFHQRKKGGAKVDPLEIPRAWPGVEILVKLKQKAEGMRAQHKRIYYQEMGERKSKIEKDHWLFPNIQSTEAWRVIKRVLGKQYYPHFLRLNRLTENGSDPDASFESLKSFSGIKSMRTLEKYLGFSKRGQRKNINWMDKQIRPGTQTAAGGPQ